MSPEPSQPTPPNPLWRALAIVYLTGAFAYACYSSFTLTGLGGWIAERQIHFFGSASTRITALLSVFVLYLPLAPFARSLGFSRSAGGSQSLRPQPTGRTFLLLCWVALSFAVLGGLGYAAALYYDDGQQKLALERVDLNAGAIQLGAGTHLLELKGAPQSALLQRLQETSGSRKQRSNYVPITSSRWKLGEPVQFVLMTSLDGYTDASTNRFTLFQGRSASFSATFTGVAKSALVPVPIARFLRDVGVLLADPCFVLEPALLVDGKLPSRARSQMYYIIPILGVGLGLMTLLGGGVGLWIRGVRKSA